MLHMSKTLSPPTKPSRVSVPVSAEVLEAFQRLAKASGTSTGKAMAEWLQDTLDAAQYMAETMEKARAAPKLVAQQLHQYALGLSDETGALLERVRQGSARQDGHAQRVLPDELGAVPPSCNTGGKVPSERKHTRGGKSA